MRRSKSVPIARLGDSAKVSTAARAERFLSGARPNAYCDSCLALSVGTRSADLVEAMRCGARFERRISECAMCGFVKLTLAAPKAKALPAAA